MTFPQWAFQSSIPLRIVELKRGSITIDDVNCRSIGLDVLRRQLAVIPQDSVLL